MPAIAPQLLYIRIKKVNKTYGITGIVLAGGESKRMGREKGSIFLFGKKLIQYSIDAIKPLCNNILISSNFPSYNNFGYEVVPDLFAGKGPMSGIYSALERSSTPQNLVVSCDIPFINTALLKHLINQPEKYAACIPMNNNLPEPLLGRYNKSLLSKLEKCLRENQLKLADFLSEEDVKWVSIDSNLSFFHPNLFLNLNRPEDLKIAESILNTNKRKK